MTVLGCLNTYIFDCFGFCMMSYGRNSGVVQLRRAVNLKNKNYIRCKRSFEFKGEMLALLLLACLACRLVVPAAGLCFYQIGTQVYDFTEIAGTTQTWGGYSTCQTCRTMLYSLSLCAPPLPSTGCTAPTSSCLQFAGVTYPAGNGPGTLVYQAPSAILYLWGTQPIAGCAYNYRLTLVYFTCDPTGRVGALTFSSEAAACVYVLTWTTKYACPTNMGTCAYELNSLTLNCAYNPAAGPQLTALPNIYFQIYANSTTVYVC